jgi:hypothetical protein
VCLKWEPLHIKYVCYCLCSAFILCKLCFLHQHAADKAINQCLTAGTYQIKQSLISLPMQVSSIQGIHIPDSRKCIQITGCTFYEHMRGSMKVTPCIFFSETIITIIKKFGTSWYNILYKVQIIFTRSLLHYQPTFSTFA